MSRIHVSRLQPGWLDTDDARTMRDEETVADVRVVRGEWGVWMRR